MKFLFVFIISITSIYSQQESVDVTNLTPLYCIQEALNSTEVITTDVSNLYDYSCMNRVRITLQNSDLMNIHKVTFYLKIWQTSNNQVMYKARHSIEIEMLPEEVITYDLPLRNKVSPPDGTDNFNDKLKWSWSIDIININQ